MRALLYASVLAGGAAIAIVGCLKRPTFQCASATECDGVGPGAMCEADGFCSLTDSACTSGRRYGESSGPNSGQCVGEIGPNPDGPIEPDGPPPDARQCFGAAAYEVCLGAAPMGTVTLSGAFDTSTDVRCLAAQPGMWTVNGQPDTCFIIGESISVNGALAVSGARPLALVAPAITISALLDVASHNASLGAAANSSACVAGTPPGSGVVAGGGAGGSFMTKGGNGGPGDMNAGMFPGGNAAAQDSVAPTVLRGGCPGQTGGSGTAASGTPGAGGGVVFLATTTLTISSSGIINASGGGGSAGGNGAGGAGGGAGGMIVLHADTFVVSGSHVLANGGGGASGGRATSAGNAGNDPASGTVTVGGTGGNGPGGDGGRGFAGNTQAGNGATGNADAGGGGGGGGGYIQSNKALAGASVSPAATIIP